MFNDFLVFRVPGCVVKTDIAFLIYSSSWIAAHEKLIETIMNNLITFQHDLFKILKLGALPGDQRTTGGGVRSTLLFLPIIRFFYDITLLFITFRANYTFIYVSKHMMIIIISISLHALRSRISNI